MSSEGTMSVMGSEVMPLDYGSMDLESSPSPTSSERTVEERREQRVVEEEEDEIPSNILEAGRLRFSIPELLVGLLLDYSIGITQLTPNAIRAGGKGEKGWYYFGPRSSSKGNRSLFSAGPSSIKGWKEKFFFVDDTEWSRRDAEVEQLSTWKAKKTKQNNYKLNEGEVEEVEKLVREEGDVVDILYLTSSKAIEAAELYGPSLLSEDGRVHKCCWGVAHPKEAKEEPRPEPVMGGSEEVQRKKRKVAELEVRRDELVEFVPRPSPLEVDVEFREREETVVRGSSKGKELIPPQSYQKSLFEATNTIGAKRFLNVTLPEVDRRQAKQEAVSQLGATVVRHALESASWTNALAQEYAESVRDHASLQSTKLVLEKRKRKIYKEKLEAQDKYIDNMRKGVTELKKNVNLLVHNGMEEHIGNFLNFSVFKNIINLYRLPTVIVAFTNCRKKLRWELDVEGCTIFPPAFDAELVAVEEEGEEGEEEEEVQGVGVEDQVDLAKVQPPEVHPISSDEVQQLAPPEAEVPPLPVGDESPQPPLLAEEQPPPPAE
ncbi:hypothetical protein SLEP1_g53010 [Rubroshorea leprosula]|uniref:Uncharacterized protein n=1 Tax=Rubroshorea leprosula TaxID=152421 RepID=A0AAV5MAU2_9ROSI|nr:hypothetical protein SLEP1_g53010 [Rubroshorea leprosula]